MRKQIKIILTLTGFLMLGSCGCIIKDFFDANDWIDRCADNSSAAYIENDAERAARCKND